MTLAELRVQHPALFYAQAWFDGHAFMQAPVPHPPRDLHAESNGRRVLPSAAELAAAYVHGPNHRAWKLFYWTRDLDDYGNQVYVGGCGQDGCAGFQIHRMLLPDHRWRSLYV